MQKLFISADMEGCASVAAPEGTVPERWSWEWSAARQRMTGEVLAAVNAATKAGYQEIIVADGHGNAHNLEPDRFPDNVRLIRSWPRKLIQMEGADDPEVRACLLVGYHAAAGTSDSVLAHSFSGLAIRTLELNGERCSEGYLNAALAGELGKPIVFVSGDQHTVEDAKRYAPQAVGFVAKESLGWRAQSSFPPNRVCELLREAVTEALNRPLPEPFIVPPPYRLEVQMMSYVAAELLSYLPGVERRDAWTVAATFSSLRAVMQFVAFSMMYTPAGLAT